MAGIFSFKCSCFGDVHEGSPSFAFRAPDPWLEQPEEVQSAGKIGDDLCFYEDEDGWHFFIRVIIEVPIYGVSDPFMWGVWVSVSRVSYEHYIETWDEPEIDRAYFGWFCNSLPYYENTYALATDVHPRSGGSRPYLTLHEADHELFKDFENGISIQKAQEIAEAAMHG